MSLTSIRLHHCPGVRSVRVAWMLHELDVPFEIVPLRLFQGEQFAPAFLAMNPSHAVPVLECRADGQPVTMIESGAIVSMLADHYPEARLAPDVRDVAARAAYLQAIHLCSATLDMMLWLIRVHEIILMPALRNPGIARQYRAKFAAEAEPRLGLALQKAPYICGEAFSAADCMIGHAVLWANRSGMCTATPFEDYLGRLSERPAFQRAFADTVGVDLSPPEDREELMMAFNG